MLVEVPCSSVRCLVSIVLCTLMASKGSVVPEFFACRVTLVGEGEDKLLWSSLVNHLLLSCILFCGCVHCFGGVDYFCLLQREISDHVALCLSCQAPC